jgi:hypothetical protein
MLDILIYVLCYIGAAYALMALPCFIWYKYFAQGGLGDGLLPVIFFILAPVSWPLFVLGCAIEGWNWATNFVRKLVGR